jgi:protein TonB
VINLNGAGIRKGLHYIRNGEEAASQSEAVAGVSDQWRWFIGTVVLVPMLLAAGVYWLHQMPAGPLARSGDAVIHVELVQTPSPATAVQQASVQTNPPIADFRMAPSIAEQAQPSFEQEASPAPPTAAPKSISLPQQQPAGAGQGQPPQAGAALRFQRLLLAHIERFQRYPGAARRDGMQGTVLVAFSMRRDGSVVRVGVKSSSGRPVLDQEAVETVRRAQPLPAIPPDMPAQLTVLLPVAFDLH